MTALFKLHGVSEDVFAYGTLIFLSQWKHKRRLYLFSRLYLGKRGRTGTIATAGWTRANWTVYSSRCELLRVWHLDVFNLVMIKSARGIDFCSKLQHRRQQQQQQQRRQQQQQHARSCSETHFRIWLSLLPVWISKKINVECENNNDNYNLVYSPSHSDLKRKTWTSLVVQMQSWHYVVTSISDCYPEKSGSDQRLHYSTTCK